MGLPGARDRAGGVESSKVRIVGVCIDGLECALVISGAFSGAPLERDRRWLREYGDLFRWPLFGVGVVPCTAGEGSVELRAASGLSFRGEGSSVCDGASS